MVGVCVFFVPLLLLVPVVPLGGVAAAAAGVAAAAAAAVIRTFGTARRVCPLPIEGDAKLTIATKGDLARHIRARVAGDCLVVRLPRTCGEQQGGRGCGEAAGR